MGQEITSAIFRQEDFVDFSARLSEETRLLEQWFREERFVRGEPVGGFELEAWLVGADARPAPVNEAFLRRLDSPLVVPELARFNVEINSTPHRLAGRALHLMGAELGNTLDACSRVAGTLGARLATVGILPTVRDEDLTLENMSALQRYQALNEQVLRLRGGQALRLDILGREHLQAERGDVMLESAATSLQVHLQVGQREAPRYYNAAKVLSAALVAVGANSPYLYGKDLWDETRIPLFEQAVSVSGAREGPPSPSRVSFGRGYVRESLLECFLTNRDRYDVLLPKTFDEPAQAMAHLRLHNGTIWRWNRPLIGFDPGDGAPHLRIEHRVVAAPNSVADTIADVALFFGLVHSLARQDPPPESLLPFEEARANFYAAARWGLQAQVLWLAGHRVPLHALLVQELLPRARDGLQRLGLEGSDIEAYLGIIDRRLATRRNGAAWQRAYVAGHGPDMSELTEAYLTHQARGAPVHEWPV